MKKFNVGKIVTRVGVATAAVGMAATSSMAALDSADLTAIQTGISSADTNYYAIGGTILTVMAGIWGFKMVKRLLG